MTRQQILTTTAFIGPALIIVCFVMHSLTTPAAESVPKDHVLESAPLRTMNGELGRTQLLLGSVANRALKDFDPTPIAAVAQIESIWKKDILSRSDLKEKERLLSDVELMRSIGKELKKKAVTIPSSENQEKQFVIGPSRLAVPSELVLRQQYVKILAQSIMWTDNPSRQDVLDAVEQTILADLDGANLSTEEKKKIAGDKIELFAALSQAAPVNAARAKAKASGWNKQVIDYASEYFLSPANSLMANIYR